ncbi:succinate dehydrogenase [bacterium]|nr:succinate dehydrogenase [Chloroflexi bacterium CFX6]RIL11204.1 MAG: succinate dehydrogenase [bacterium]
MAILSAYRTTVGKKIVMAVTGLIWVGYVVLHMFGNLKFFNGAGDGLGTINAWAHFLRVFGQEVVGYAGVLWLARVVLLVALVLHVATAIQLKRLNGASRPVAYQRRGYLQTDLPARSMWWGGVFILMFVVYHVLHMTAGTVHPAFVEGDVFHNLTVGLGEPLAGAFYLTAMVALGLHLYHGTWSVFQTLGVDVFDRSSAIRRAGQALALVIAGGFMLVPLSILLGFMR